MPDPVLELADRSRALTLEERSRLIDLLLVSLEDTAPREITESWDREIERRIKAYKDGEVEAYDLEDVMKEARRIAP